MLLVDLLPQSDVSHITPLIKPMQEIDDNKSSNLPTSESAIAPAFHSFSLTNIPLNSSKPILAVSPNYILINEYTKRRKRLVIIDHNLQRFSIRFPYTDVIIDALWYHNEEKFLLLTPREILSCEPKNRLIETVMDIKPDGSKIFKSFAFDSNRSSLVIAYDEWESKFLDRWQQDKKGGCWTLIERHPLHLTLNEFIGIILVINEDGYFNIAITIYNYLTEEWRMEIRGGEMCTCLRKIRLPGSDPAHDYRMIAMDDTQSDIAWLIHSPADHQIIALDRHWQMKHLNYKFPIFRMARFRENNLIIRTANRIHIRNLL